jgi:hypothetical protein
VNDDPAGDLERGAQDITRELNVVTIRLFAPTTLETFLREIESYDQGHIDRILNQLELWPGFGKDAVRIEPP